ncbi:MAG: iron uptake transporter deferrochelatase/peroxidase subunit [Actinomycetota bacterium]|nr:iron uptake transporter deferrochelatase/peroxidase subunit [Actinomycetota bacterium]
MSGFSRRSLLVGGAGAVGAGAVGAFVAGRATAADVPAPAASGRVVPFFGRHQAGIVTPAQDRLYFAAFDVITDDRDELRELLAAWTLAAERMTRGLEAAPDGAVGGPYVAPPADTGEALDLPAASLTLTFGVGPSLFADAAGRDRFGISDRRPAALVHLPHFAGDNLDAGRSGGDLCVQACADDPQVAFHAVRNLARIGFGVVSLRWSQLGFGRTSSTSTAQSTPRNLFGFKDGTANLKAEETDELNRHVWVQPGDDVDWMTGGSYLVARRINMHIETWDRTSLGEQENIVGRTKGTGAPMSGGTEFTEPDFALTGTGDAPLVALGSHVRLAHPTSHGGVRILRRGYNFTDGSDGLGRLDAGLFFIAYMRDPGNQFVPMQRLLSAGDLMMEYLEHTGSALFAVLPGVGDAGGETGRASLGDGLLA